MLGLAFAAMSLVSRGRSSNREGTWSAARLEIGGQAGGKIPEAGEATQDGRERACEMDARGCQKREVTSTCARHVPTKHS
jgi:hypothetical protein